MNCTPAGAPNPPSCRAPITVPTEQHQILTDSYPGNTSVVELTFPKHVNRLESDGETVTTFLVYDVCEVPIDDVPALFNLCPKTSVSVKRSTDGGKSWSPTRFVPNAGGQQFLSGVAFDASTATLNIAYYSTEKGPQKTRIQVFLAQVFPARPQ